MEIRRYVTLIQDPKGFPIDRLPEKGEVFDPRIETVVLVRHIEDYLDEAITKWREVKEKKPDDVISTCYIDAYQSARVSLLGRSLP